MEALREAMKRDFSTLDVDATMATFGVTASGLGPDDVTARRAVIGPNEIAQGKPTPWYVVLARQFASPLIYILLVAAGLTALQGEVGDVVIILTVLAINAGIGFHQERKAERAINNIKGMSAPQCRVRRGGEVSAIDARELVPGDLILLEEGDRVPADARLINAVRLRVEESVFTGESIAASKNAETLAVSGALADRLNLVFMGTHVTAGRCEAVVTAVGMATELGKIASLVQSADDLQTPLQKKLEEFSHFIAKAVLGVCALMMVVGIFAHGQPLMGHDGVLMTAIALAIGAIPEGLPVVITLVLAIGVRRMAQHRALIRKMPTVETLGSATVICTDKTGTLTRNEMVVTGLYLAGREYVVTGTGYRCDGAIAAADGTPVANDPVVTRFVETAVMCNNATVKQRADGEWVMVGDGTEGALMTLAGKADRQWLNARDRAPRRGEVPFDSKTKFMVTVHSDAHGDGFVAHQKGSPEAVLARCSHWLGPNGPEPLSDEVRQRIIDRNLGYADEALRVLGFARRTLPADTVVSDFVESEQEGYTFLGLAGMMDLPRQEAVDAVARCRRAGIRVVMITGDHAATARAVGRKVGIYDEGMRMLTGDELARLSDDELFACVESVAIYARTSPEDKMRIIQALQKHGHVVSMTGDGVNDAPALTRADIGVAMGRTGTDVAREAAGMVLEDDNFASIVAAVEEGRIIFNNLRKAISFLVSTNAGEVLTLLTASFMGMPTPLRAAQLLWVNLVTDSFTTIALGVDPAEGDEMVQPPRKPNEPLLTRAMRNQVIGVTFLMCIGTLVAYRVGYWSSEGLDELTRRAAGQSMAFGAMVFFQLFNVFNCRSHDKSLLSVGPFANRSLVWSVLLAAGLQLAAMYLPILQRLLGTVALNATQFMATIGIAALVIPGVEAIKWATRKGRTDQPSPA